MAPDWHIQQVTTAQTHVTALKAVRAIDQSSPDINDVIAGN
jgi:hypothetical protein